MSSTTIHSIIDIPELVACITCYLTSTDIARAMATCQTWSKRLQPFLWTSFSSKYSRPPMITLARNLHHIRIIDLDVRDFRYKRVRNYKAFDELLKTLACNDLNQLESQHLLDAAEASARNVNWFNITRGSMAEHKSSLWYFLQKLLPKKGINVTHPQVETLACGDPRPVEPRHSIETATAFPAGVINIRRLNITIRGLMTEQLSSSWCNFLKLLHTTGSTLTHLQMDTYSLGEFMPPQLIPAISEMRNLQHFTIITRSQKERWFLSLLRACLPLPRLSELYCDFPVDSGGHTFLVAAEDVLEEPRRELKAILEEAIAARTSINGSVEVKIKALHFPDPECDAVIRIYLLLLSSDLVEVETLQVPEIEDDRSEEFYEGIVRKHCPALKHLIIPPHDGKVCGFIRGATGLKTVRANCFCDAYGYLAGMVIPEIVKHHSETLEELEILKSRNFRSVDQRTVLTSCKQLKRYWVVPDGSFVHSSLKCMDTLGFKWSCLKLRELGLTLDRTIDDELIALARHQELPALSTLSSCWKEEPNERWMYDLDRAGKAELIRAVDAWAARQIYKQIGQLLVVETLALGATAGPVGSKGEPSMSEWDLTLSKGYLAELAGLKNLRHFHMRTDYWSRMGQAEVEFMDAEWPLLGDISFDLKKQELSTLVKQPHWQWLHQTRPNLRLRALEL